MKRLFTILLGAGLLAAASSSCILVVDDSDDQDSRELCASCGEWSDFGDCCDEDAEHCSECGLIAGSPGCCK